MTNFRFHKNEHLKNVSVIESIFSNGKSFAVYPIRILWVTKPLEDGHSPFQITISVPKRKFPKAVDRNRIKRQIREAYRLNKHLLFQKLEPNNTTQWAMVFLYTGKKNPNYTDIEQSIIGILNRLKLGKKVKS